MRASRLHIVNADAYLSSGRRRWIIFFHRVIFLLSSATIFLTFSTAKSIEEPKQKAMIVAAFGTSLTNSAGWLLPLQEKLMRCLGRQVSVRDFGANGMTSEGALTAVSAVIRSEPDVVLIEFSVNDAAWFKGTSARRSRENTTKIVRAIKDAQPNAQIFLMTMNPTFGLRGLIRTNVEEYYRSYKILADRLGVGLIDNFQNWKTLSKDELSAGIPDGVHPLPEIAAQILVPAIARAIAGAACVS